MRLEKIDAIEFGDLSAREIVRIVHQIAGVWIINDVRALKNKTNITRKALKVLEKRGYHIV